MAANKNGGGNNGVIVGGPFEFICGRITVLHMPGRSINETIGLVIDS